MSSTKALLVLLALGAALRATGSFDDPGHDWDEAGHVESARSSSAFGTTKAMTWMHPPLGILMLSGSIAALGDNPYGWRVNGVVLGAATVVFLYLVGATLFPGTPVPLVAAALLALDPFHVFFSRATAMMEIPVTCFFLAYLWLMLLFSERGRGTLPLAGVALGLTMATKVYYVLAVPLVVFHVVRRARARGEPLRPLLVDLALTQVVLPAAIVLFTYFRWFGRGFTLPDFVQMQADALRTLREMTVERFPHGAALQLRGAPWEWFLRPTSVGRQVGAVADGAGRFLVEINNPPFRLLVIPAAITVCVHAWRRRSLDPLLVPLLVAAVYLPALATARPIFSYSAIPLLPLAYLVVAHALALLAARTRRGDVLTAAFVGAVVLWGLYAFPLASARPVPLWLYRPLLQVTTMLGGA